VPNLVDRMVEVIVYSPLYVTVQVKTRDLIRCRNIDFHFLMDSK